MAHRRDSFVLGIVAIIVIAAVLVTHFVEIYRQKTDAQQELIRFGVAAGIVAVLGIILLVALLWLLGFVRLPRRENLID